MCKRAFLHYLELQARSFIPSIELQEYRILSAAPRMSSTNAQSPVRTTIILSSSGDWDEWLEVVKTKAEAGKIWEYVDPSKAKDELKVLSKPEVPRAKDVNPAKTTVANLSDDELDELKLLRYDFKHQLQLYERQDAALFTLKTFIQETISRTFLSYTFKKESTYDVLVALRKRVAPTDRARKLELSQKYEELKEAPGSQEIEAWLQAWEQTYTKCKEQKLPVVAGDLPLYDFLHAVSKVALNFATVWTVNLERMEADKESLPDLFRIVSLFRDHQRLANARKNEAAQSARPLPTPEASPLTDGQDIDSDLDSDLDLDQGIDPGHQPTKPHDSSKAHDSSIDSPDHVLPTPA